MAKALMGHLAQDPHLAVQVVALKARVAALEAELETLRAHTEVKLPEAVELAGMAQNRFESEFADLERATPALA